MMLMTITLCITATSIVAYAIARSLHCLMHFGDGIPRWGQE